MGSRGSGTCCSPFAVSSGRRNADSAQTRAGRPDCTLSDSSVWVTGQQVVRVFARVTSTTGRIQRA